MTSKPASAAHRRATLLSSPCPWHAPICAAFSLAAAVTSDQDGGCDCYVQGSVANRQGSVEAQTALKKRQLHTVWEEGLALPLAEEELRTATLTLTLRTCDRFSRHSVAGELCLGLDGVSVPLGVAQWGELKTSVKVRLSLSRWWSMGWQGLSQCSWNKLQRASQPGGGGGLGREAGCKRKVDS